MNDDVKSVLARLAEVKRQQPPAMTLREKWGLPPADESGPAATDTRPMWAVVDLGLPAADLPIHDRPVTTLNESGERFRVRSETLGGEFWIVPDDAPVPDDGLPVFTVTELVHLWAHGTPTPELLRQVMDVKRVFGGRVEGVTPVALDPDHLAADTREVMEAGAVPIWPVPWRHRLVCAACGPVPWAAPGEVLCCPWCFVEKPGGTER